MILDFINAYPFVIAFLLGLIPALIWLWFWLREDVHPEPAKMITLSFVGGMVAVVFALPLQQLVYNHIQEQNALAFTLWATIEELLKFGFVYVIALRNKAADEPVDDVIYLIISALGFITAENTLFLLGPLQGGDFVGTIVNGNLRFIGASLLHIMSSATIGVCMALAYYKSHVKKKIYLILGIILAIILHTSFNLFIINKSGGNIFFIFGAVWIGIIALLVMFEKVKSEKP
jgi:RsiW-degrading membrane proteinase PrsW (M82 family)